MDKVKRALIELRVIQLKPMFDVLKTASSEALLDAYSITVYNVPYENLTDKGFEAVAEDTSKYRIAVNVFSDMVRTKHFKIFIRRK